MKSKISIIEKFIYVVTISTIIGYYINKLTLIFDMKVHSSGSFKLGLLSLFLISFLVLVNIISVILLKLVITVEVFIYVLSQYKVSYKYRLSLDYKKDNNQEKLIINKEGIYIKNMVFRC